jgi:hypothetical protein
MIIIIQKLQYTQDKLVDNNTSRKKAQKQEEKKRKRMTLRFIYCLHVPLTRARGSGVVPGTFRKSFKSVMLTLIISG